MHSVNPEQRGTGVLVVDVSTIGAADEKFWANTERKLPGSSFLQVRAKFGAGSAVGSEPWTVGPGIGSDQLRRDAKLHLPYFNLADGTRSTDASLLLEVVALKRASEYGQSDDDECSDRSSSLNVWQLTEVCQQGRGEVVSSNVSKVLAAARLDVQTALLADFSRSGAMSTASSTENNVVFNIANTKVAEGTTHRSCSKRTDCIPVSVKLSFAKPASNAAAESEQRVESTAQRAGHEHDVPAFFVVSTTLFDCAKTMNEAELGVYIRYGDTGATSRLSSGVRGEIVVHESFEWNISADLSTMFAPHAWRGATLIIALVDKAVKYNESPVSRNAQRRGVMQDPEETVVGVLELSCEELVLCGPGGRWRPLRACLSSTRQERHGCVGRDIVGEALVAFSWMPRGPAADALPKAPADRRLRKSRKRPREKSKRLDIIRDSHAGPSRNRAEEDMNNAIDAKVHHSLAEAGTTTSSGSNNNGGSTQQGTVVYIHVWDALLPLDRPDSAFYFTVRLSCRGSRVQRVSTKPARGRGGLRRMSTSAAGGSGSRFPGENTSRERRSHSGSMHVVWDEHLLLRVEGPVEEGAVVELVLRDASVDDETAHHAHREGEPFQAFAERLGLEQAGVPTTSATSYSSTSFDQLRIPGPVVYHLKLQHPWGLPEGGTHASASTNKGERAARDYVGFGGVEVRMAGLVLSRDGTNGDSDEDVVETFLRRKADVARIPGGVKRRLSAVSVDNGAVRFSPMLLPEQEIRRPRRRPRLLDLSAANGLFYKFAEGGADGSSAVETVNPGWSSPRADASGNTFPSSGNRGESSVERLQSSSEPILTDGALGLVTQQYFPRLARQTNNNGKDSAAEISPQSTTRCSHPAATARQARHGMSFTGFVSWLRDLPQDDLGTAGLLVSPRTALQKTGRAMDEDAQGLAAALQLTQQPTAMLIGGWCSIPLTSTTEYLALDRVRIGWGRIGGGHGSGDGVEAEEIEWQHHTELLQRDVAILRKVVEELEQRYGGCGDPAVRTERADTTTSTCGVDADASRATREDEKLEEFDDLLPSGHKAAVAARRDPAAERKQSECCSVAALYFEQEAARLRSAAEHLKEALRCAGDTITRGSAHTPGHRGVGGRFSSTRTDVETGFPEDSSRMLQAIVRTKPSGDGQACYHHRCYGLLLQHIKQVTACLTEIAALQRRAAAVAQQTDESSKPQADSRRRQGCCSYGVSCDTELPRSALELVKRIRRAQNAARSQQPPEPLSPARDVPAAGEGAALPLLHEQDYGGGLPSLPVIENRDSLVEDGTEAKGKQPQQDRGGSPPKSRAAAGAIPVRDDGGASLQTLASPRAPFIDMLRGPSLLQNIERRLENIRSGFHEKRVDLPAAFSETSAQRVLEIARGVGQETGLVPLAALCCPIDRFALHVFRTAGAAEEGGSLVFTSVQELAGMGGLETHATEKSLWTAAAQAGILDVDRWVVAAVLWQVTGAVATENARGVWSPHLSRQDSIGAVAEEEMGGGSSDKHAIVLAEATSLWKELRDEAFLSVLGRSGGIRDQGATPIVEHRPSSTALTPTPGGQEQWQELLALTRDSGEDGHDTEQHPRQRYNVLQSDSSSFDLALMRTLALAGREGAGPGLGAATQASAGTGSGSLDTGNSSLKCVENILLHNFVIAGFAEGSRLDVSAIVDAVSVRRRRVLSAATTAAAVADRRCPSRGTAEKDADKLIQSDKNQHHPVGPPHLGGLSQGGRQSSLPTELSNGEAGATSQTIDEGGGDSVGVGDAAGVSMESNVEARILAGIPIELRELFRAAALAKTVRQRKGVSQEGCAQSDELAAAEQKVSCVLDSDRTLESAPFSDGRTALHHAAARGDGFLVRLLLERGCQPHLKDFGGKRACDLTRDLKCLRLLGALKKAPEPSAISLRTRTREKTATSLSGEAGDGTLGPLRSSVRAITSVEFAVSFRPGQEEAAEQTFGGTVRSPSENLPAGELERGEDGRTDAGAIGTAVWVEGVARSYDVRNKMLFIDANTNGGDNIPGPAGAAASPTADCSGTAETENAATPARNQPTDEEKKHCTEEGQRGRRYARHVLDVRLLSCLSSQGEELFDQLRAFSCAFSTRLARASLDIAVDAAADLGAVCREVFGELVFEIVKDGVATEAYRNEELAVAAKGTATAAVGSVLRAAQRAVILARRLVKGRAARRKNQGSADVVSNNAPGEERLHLVKVPNSITAVKKSSMHMVGKGDGESLPGHQTTTIDKSVAARMCFRCTAIVTEKRRKVPRRVVKASAAGVGGEDAASLSSGVMDRKRHDLQYLARWTIQGGVATVVVRSSSYLNAVAAGKRGGDGCRSINLEGRDACMERVLEYHGVSLAACLQTFDVMQDMEDPSIVLDMLAAGICQLSTRYAEEGIEFSCLCQSDQDALQADVRSQLYHAAGHGAGAAPNWEELSITMQAYGGVTSVGLVRNGGNGKTPNGGKNLVVSAPTAGGWFSPEEAAAALTSPPPSGETAASSPPSSPPPEPLPPSAVDVVLTLMRCNPCEVLASLSPGIGVDGRISLIGQVNNIHGPGPTVRTTKEGKDKDDGGGRGTGESLLRKQQRREGEETAIRREDKVGGVYKGFRCSVEVAWDKDEGGVFVQRFGMEPDERRPRIHLRAVGIRGFAVAQLPVTLEDIDEVWDQAGNDSASSSGASSSSGDRPLGSTSSSSNSVRSSEGGGGGGRGGEGAFQPEQAAPSTAQSSEASVLKRAEVATVENERPTASEQAALSMAKKSTEADVLERVEVATVKGESPTASEQAAPSMAKKSTEADVLEPAKVAAAEGESPTASEQAALRMAKKSTEADVLEPAKVAAAEGESPTASETAAQVAVAPSTSKASKGDGEDGETNIGSSGCEKVDRRSGERSEVTGAATASEPSAECASPKPSGKVVTFVEDRCEADGPAPVRDETSVEDQKHTGLEPTTTNEELVSESSVDTTMPEGGIGEGRTGQQNQEEGHDIDQQAAGPPQAEFMKGENGEKLTVEQDQKDRLAAPVASATERVEPTVQNDDGEVLHREPSEGHVGSENDRNNDVGTITAAERADDTGAAEGKVTTHPVERVEDAADLGSGLASDPDHEALKHSTEADTSRGMMPVEDGNGDAGESSRPRETRSSPRLVDRTPTDSLPQGAPLAAGGSAQEGTGIQDTQNAGEAADLDHYQRLDNEKALEEEPREREQNDERQAALGHAPGGVGGAGAGQDDNVDTSPTKVEATSVSRKGGGVEEDTIDDKNTPLAVVASRLWEFPPSFEALVTLSTVNEAVECTVEGEIVPELRGDSGNNRVFSWKRVCCLYKIAAGKGSHPPPQADIDLEDDEAQARLEDLLEREYGLSMEDVLERFSSDTDLGSGEAVVRSFTDSICQLRPSLLVQPQMTKGDEVGHDGGGDSAVHKAVGAALRGGGGEGPEWREMQVRVGESRVLEVAIITTGTSRTTTLEQRGQRTESDNGNQSSEPGTSDNRVVDCSSVASPTALRPHLLSGGVPASAVDALERAGFAGARSVVDLADVLAALAHEAESRERVVAQSSPTIRTDKGERKWPGVDPDRDGTQLLRLSSERIRGGSETVHECRVAVTGSSERFKLEISPVLDGDDVPSASVVLTTISCLRPLGTPVVMEEGRRSDAHAKSETNVVVVENSSARAPQPEDASSRIVESREADTAGLNVGDRVEARFGGKTDWFPGTVRAINAAHEIESPSRGSGVRGGGSGSGRGGAPRSNLPTIAIDYDDGDVEERAPRVRVRLRGQKQPRFLSEGDEVDVKRGKKISLARVVARPSSSEPKEEGHYDLQLLDDGGRRGVRGEDALLVENCPRSAIMALHGWPPGRK